MKRKTLRERGIEWSVRDTKKCGLTHMMRYDENQVTAWAAGHRSGVRDAKRKAIP